MRSIAAAIVWIATVAMGLAFLWIVFGTDFLGHLYLPTGIEFTLVDYLAVYLAVGAFAAVTISYVSIGLLLADRSGAGRIAGVLLAGGSLLAAVPFGYTVGAALLFDAPANPLWNAIFLLGPALYGAGVALILPGLALVFPDGRLPSPAWRAPTGIVVGLLVAGAITVVVTPGQIEGTPGSSNPFGIAGLPQAVSASSQVLTSVGLLGILILGVGAEIARYRRGNTLARQQLRWFAAAVFLAGIPLAFSFLPAVGGPGWFALAAVGLLLVPVAVWIAVTRHGLYQIDRIISRTLSYAIVTGILGLVFAAGVIGGQTILAGVTGNSDTLAVAASTLVAFALFQPLRRRVQRIVDRRFNRARVDAERTSHAFAARLRDRVDLDSVAEELDAAVRASVAPRQLGLWLREHH